MVEDGSVVVPKDSNNNVKLTYTSSSSSLGAGASSDATTLNTQGLPAGTTRYVYVIVSIVELLNDVDFEGTFGWDLAKGEAITSNTTGGSQSIVVDTTDEKLYNKSAMENIQLVVGVENTEPDYPMIEDECFTGWYFDSGLNNKVEFPIIPTADTILYPTHLPATSDLTYYYDSDALGYYVGDGAGAYFGYETDIIIPDVYNDSNGLQKVIGINDIAFYQLENITSVIMPNTIISIGSSAFMGCTELTDITIPRNVEYILDSSFESCTGLTSITFDNGVTSIGALAFSSCTSLESIYIPASITSISADAFSYCSGLKSIAVDRDNAVYCSEGNCIIERSTNALILGCNNSIIPSGVTSIEYSAFEGCSGLISITIPDSVTSISDGAFNSCSGLTSIIVSSGNKKYRSEGNCIIERSYNILILGCKNSIIPSGVTSIGSHAFEDCSDLTSITISDSVTSIGIGAFKGCGGLTSINIPNSVMLIMDTAFESCSGLTSITVSSGNRVYRSEGNCIIKRSSNTLIIGCKKSIIPSGVTSIGDRAFQNCYGLTSITIPDSVTSIGYSAFLYCSSLTNITIGSGVKKIGSYAFNNCSKLTSATFKNTTGWTVTTSSTATTGTAVTISTTDLAANATLLKTAHVRKYWNRA